MVTNLPELVVMNIQFKLSDNYYNTQPPNKAPDKNVFL